MNFSRAKSSTAEPRVVKFFVSEADHATIRTAAAAENLSVAQYAKATTIDNSKRIVEKVKKSLKPT